MLRKIVSKHNRILLVISAICIFITLGCCLLMSFLGKEKEVEPILLEKLVGDCYYFPGETVFSRDLFQTEAKELRLVYGRNQSGLFEDADGVRYVGKKEKVVSAEFPVYQKNGAVIYLPDTVREYRFICTDFSIEQMKGTWVSYGAAFREDNSRAFGKDVFFIDFYDGIYVNAMPFIVEEYVPTEVSVNSFVRLNEDSIDVWEFDDGVLSRRTIVVTGQTMIAVGNEKVSYYSLKKFCKDAYETEQPRLEKNGVLLAGNYYYYFLGERIEIDGPCLLYETADGIYLENEEKSFLLPDCPLYDTESSRVILPTDYMLMQINQHLFYCLPALTDVKMSEEAIYVAYEDTIQSYQEILLHDGQEHYLLLNEAMLRLGTIELTISPLSCIYITDEMELCFYQYDSEEFFSFPTDGKEAELLLANGDVIFLYDRMIRRKDGTLDLLQKDPTVFPHVK